MRKEKGKIMDYTYILECNDGTYYTGWTNNIKKRYTDHNQKKGAKYTKGRGPLKLVYLKGFETKKEALQQEIAIKKLSRLQKQELIQNCPLEEIMMQHQIKL